MSGGSYPFEIGTFNCLALLDGHVKYGPEIFFSNVEQDAYEAELRERDLPTEYVQTPYTFLLVDTGETRILVDMGAEQKEPAGLLIPNMRRAGIEPDSIDWVVITHCHPDHVGGALDGSGKPNYKNARYLIWDREVRFWKDDKASELAPTSHVQTARRAIEALKDRFFIIEEEYSILPGINVLFAPGHTPGHMVVEVRSGDDHLYYTADSALHPLHLVHPSWQPSYDILPEQAIRTKHQIFDRVSSENALVIGQHFPPFPGIGHVLKQEKGWLWQPLGHKERKI